MCEREQRIDDVNTQGRGFVWISYIVVRASLGARLIQRETSRSHGGDFQLIEMEKRKKGPLPPWRTRKNARTRIRRWSESRSFRALVAVCSARKTEI